jgi:hypothetical protein
MLEFVCVHIDSEGKEQGRKERREGGKEQRKAKEGTKE